MEPLKQLEGKVLSFRKEIQHIGDTYEGFTLLEIFDKHFDIKIQRTGKIDEPQYQCGSCEQPFEEPIKNSCPHCGSGNWVKGCIDEPEIAGDLLNNQQREDLLVTALEGGSNYWYNLPNLSMLDRYRASFEKEKEPLVSLMMRAILAGESCPVHDVDADGDEHSLIGHFDLNSICKGEALMKEKSLQHWNNIIEESWDAETADVWFQYCVLGDIVYG